MALAAVQNLSVTRYKLLYASNLTRSSSLAYFGVRTSQPPTDEQQTDTANTEEQPVVEWHMHRQVAHVMDLKDMMIDDSFDEIECAPAKQQLAGE